MTHIEGAPGEDLIEAEHLLRSLIEKANEREPRDPDWHKHIFGGARMSELTIAVRPV